MSHSYGTFMISSFVTICFLPFPLRDVLLIEQYLTVNGLTLIRRNSHSLYKKKTPLGVPISIQIQLSIQGNNINHIISYHDDKVGLALSVSCRKSSASFFFFFYWIWPNALAFMLVFMSGKLLFDIQITSGGVLSYVTGAQGKLQGTPLPPVSHDGLVLISGEKLRCTVIKKRVLTNFFPSLCISFFPDRGMTSCQLCQLLRGLFLIVRSDLLGFYFESSAILIAMPSLQWV